MYTLKPCSPPYNKNPYTLNPWILNTTHRYTFPSLGMEKQGQLSPEEAAKNFWVLDAGGLITTARGSLKPHVQKFARDAGEEGDHEGEKLLEVVKRVSGWGLM